ncbi:hypothetical protein EHS25_010014 [Saitozyma podzolica]|jgi:hypothetical protein|uniref:Glycosyltransferase family 92 protein n=1 Tax=Saitozyma podzolica TaxID=1890683 RepID=A0A427YID3_9TREE|nr:hypothetical protein EHS25_010014 [Saitozyma podzolica]
MSLFRGRRFHHSCAPLILWATVLYYLILLSTSDSSSSGNLDHNGLPTDAEKIEPRQMSHWQSTIDALRNVAFGVPKKTSQGASWRTGARSMVSTRPGHAEYNHTFPYEGSSYLVSAAVHPTKGRNATGYVLTSAWYFEGESSFPHYTHHGVCVNDSKLLSFDCTYGGETVRGIVERQGRNEYITVDCPLPSWTTDVFNLGSRQAKDEMLQVLRDTDISIDVWIALDPKQFGDDVLERLPKSPVRVPTAGHAELLFIHHPVDGWETPMRDTQLSICTAPLWFDWGLSMTDLLEWRVHHLFQGVEVVHWYSRDTRLASWVHAANSALGTADTYTDAPFLSRRAPSHLVYSDQTVWQLDCMMRYGFADEWQAFIDVDEYLSPLDQPQRHGTLARLDRLAPNVGSLKMYQVYYGGERIDSLPSVPGLPKFPRDAWSHWQPNYELAGARYTKGIYRPDAIRTHWVHSSITLAQGWDGAIDDAQADTPGLLRLLHSREAVYPGLNFTQAVHITGDVRQSWEIIADTLRGRDRLYSLDLSS